MVQRGGPGRAAAPPSPLLAVPECNSPPVIVFLYYDDFNIELRLVLSLMLEQNVCPSDGHACVLSMTV